MSRHAVLTAVAVSALTLACSSPPVQTQDDQTTAQSLGADLRTRAEAGDVGAQISLGDMYREGQGVPQDGAEAVAWYRLAAEQGDATAQFNLGMMYEGAGVGVPQDQVEAAAWISKAAEQGDVRAQINLGGRYMIGGGVPVDDVKAYMWLNLAAARATGEMRELGAVPLRDSIAELLTLAELRKAQRLAREWTVAHP